MANNIEDSPSTDAAETGSDLGPSVDRERAPNTLLNALIGGVVGVFLSFIPFSPILGGGIAGYLEGGEYASGAKVGALAGIVAFVPFVFIIGALLFFVPVTSGPGVVLELWVSVIFVLLIAAAYVIGLSVVGGVLGVYVKEEV